VEEVELHAVALSPEKLVRIERESSYGGGSNQRRIGKA
jgi:hypothetical protein